MRTKKDEKFKLESVEELLGVVNEESAMDIEISKIQSFRAHPFKVLDDDKMQELIDSISVNGILTPVLVRPLGMDTYEMISGHRRMHAAKIVGLDGYIIIFTSNMSQETYQKKIPDSLKSRFDMVYYFVNVPGQEKQLFIQNSALELIEKLQIHFGKKVSYESITDELEKLIAYDNLRDIKRKVQDIVFCEFFKIR